METPSTIGARLDDLEPEFKALLKTLIQDIGDEYRASDDPEDSEPGMQVTIATNETAEKWSYQTGDNSYTGSAYGLPHWAVLSLYRDSDCGELAKQAIDDLANLIFQ
jgi:hypothetical protein